MKTQTTPQQRMKAKLETLPIPVKEIEVYGSQIVVTCWSRQAAEKWSDVLCKFSHVRKMLKTVDYAKKNTRSVMNPSTVEVWRVYATI